MHWLACKVAGVKILAPGQAILFIGCRTEVTGLIQDEALCHIRIIPIMENWAGKTVMVSGWLVPLEVPQPDRRDWSESWSEQWEWTTAGVLREGGSWPGVLWCIDCFDSDLIASTNKCSLWWTALTWMNQRQFKWCLFLFNAAELLFASGTLLTPDDCKFMLQLAGVNKRFIEHFLHINRMVMALP